MKMDVKRVIPVIVCLIAFMTNCARNAVSFIYVETNIPNIEDFVFTTTDTVFRLNSAMWEKLAIRHIGRDKYYEILLKTHQSSEFSPLTFREKITEGRRMPLQILGNDTSTITLRDAQNKVLFGDSTYLEQLRLWRNEMPVFMYHRMRNKYKSTPYMVYRIGALPESLRQDFETMDKESFMQLYESCLDSILNMRLRYRKKPGGKVYDSVQYPLNHKLKSSRQ